MNTLKAYIVQEADEGTGGIVFAEFNAKARRIGASLYGDGDFLSVECRRAPEYDRYAPGPVPELALLEAGWWFPCSATGRRLYADDNPIRINGQFYRSPWVWLDHIHRTHSEAGEKALGRRMAQRFLPPECPILAAHIHRRGNKDTVLVRFEVPGSRFGGSWYLDRPDVIQLDPDDVPAWQALQAGRRKRAAVHHG